MAQNSHQTAKNRKGLVTAQGLYDEMIRTMAQEVINLKDKVINDFISEQTGSEIIDVEEVSKRAYIATAEDGSEVLRWDNQPRIYFAPIGTQLVNGTMRPVLRFQRLPYVVKPEEPPSQGLSDGTLAEEPYVYPIDEEEDHQ